MTNPTVLPGSGRMGSVQTNGGARQRTGDEIMKAVLVRYTVKPEHVERNQGTSRLRSLNCSRTGGARGQAATRTLRSSRG